MFANLNTRNEGYALVNHKQPIVLLIYSGKGCFHALYTCSSKVKRKKTFNVMTFHSLSLLHNLRLTFTFTWLDSYRFNSQHQQILHC